MIHFNRLSREEFLGWIGQEPLLPRAALFSSLPGAPLNRGDVIVAWEQSDRGVWSAPVLAVESRDIRDFLSFVGTYVGNYKPFTAFVRVVSIEYLQAINQRGLFSLPYSSDDSDFPLANLVGIAIAEARLLGGDRFSKIEDISTQACLATMSSVAIQALYQGADVTTFNKALENWILARSTGRSGDVSKPERLMSFWRHLYEGINGLSSVGMRSDISLIVRSSLEDRKHDSVNSRVPSQLAHYIPAISAVLMNLDASREARVRAFDSFIPMLKPSYPIELREISLGYIAARVSGGSLTYLNLLSDVDFDLPLSILWFGFFAATIQESDVLSVGDCLGRRVSRTLLTKQSVFDTPVADISIEELALYSPEVFATGKFRTEHQGLARIELAPAVLGVFRIDNSRFDDSNHVITTEELRDAGKALDFLNDFFYRIGTPRRIANTKSGRPKVPGRRQPRNY